MVIYIRTIVGLLPSSHKLASWGGTDGLNIVVFQFHPFASQLVQYGCVDLWAMVPDIIEALVIHHYENNMWGNSARSENLSLRSV